jgi:acylglycerol lipase
MFKELKTPYLMIMGGNDKVVDPFLVVDLEREAGTEDRMTFVYKEMWHSVWRGEEMGDIVNIVEHWIEERTK